MSKYEGLCQAYAKTEPHRLNIDQMLRELPEKLRRAIAADLGAPEGPNKFLTEMYNRPVGYVFHAREEANAKGELAWQAIGDGRLLNKGPDGVLRFGIGVTLEKPGGSYLPTMIYLRFSIEDISENAVKLLIANKDGMVTVDPSKADGFASAAQAINDWLTQALGDPHASPVSIGFNR
jgi:hypothetical protein